MRAPIARTEAARAIRRSASALPGCRQARARAVSSMVCIDGSGDLPRLYEPSGHRFHALDVDARGVGARNAAAVAAVAGAHRGCTIRFIADLAKVSAAYRAPESLVLRDAGCLLAIHCLCAEWLGLTACPLGFLGQDLVGALGFPTDRFLGVGGVQIGERGPNAGATAA